MCVCVCATMLANRCVGVCIRRSENLFVCFGAKPAQRTRGRDFPRDRKWTREGRSQRRQRVSWQRRAEENSRFEIAVQRRTQSAEGGNEKMEAGQSSDESAFLVALWKFRAKYTPAIACKCTESSRKLSNRLLPSCAGADPSLCLFVCSFPPPSRLCFAYLQRYV